MPDIQIEVRTNYPPETESGLMEAVHSALRDTFAIKPDNRAIRFVSYEPHRFECPPGLDQPDRYTQVTIDCFPGRSLDAKRQLYRTIVTNLEPFGIPPDHVKILLRETPAENWGIEDGQAACDVTLGYNVRV